jgi:hypothetical protein
MRGGGGETEVEGYGVERLSDIEKKRFTDVERRRRSEKIRDRMGSGGTRRDRL